MACRDGRPCAAAARRSPRLLPQQPRPDRRSALGTVRRRGHDRGRRVQRRHARGRRRNRPALHLGTPWLHPDRWRAVRVVQAGADVGRPDQRREGQQGHPRSRRAPRVPRRGDLPRRRRHQRPGRDRRGRVRCPRAARRQGPRGVRAAGRVDQRPGLDRAAQRPRDGRRWLHQPRNPADRCARRTCRVGGRRDAGPRNRARPAARCRRRAAPTQASTGATWRPRPRPSRSVC